MVDFAKLVLEVDTSDLEQGEAKLKNLTVAGDKAEKSAKKTWLIGKGQRCAVKTSNQTSRKIRQWP